MPQRRAKVEFSHFGPDANLFEDLEELFRQYGESGIRKGPQLRSRRRRRRPSSGILPAPSPPGRTFARGTDLLYYEGLHGAVQTENVDIAKHVDLLIGVVPIINLEWIQKLHRDRTKRGYSTEAVTDTILRRMPDYVRYICPSSATPTSTSSVCP